MVLAAMVLPTTGFYESTKNVGSSSSSRRRRRDVVVVGIPLSELLLIGVPGKRLAITFSVIDIFACGFLQRVKHRLDIILRC